MKRVLILTVCFLSAFPSVYAQEIRDTLTASSVEYARDLKTVPGVYGIDIEKTLRITTPTGEGDIFKYIQFLPGVATGAEGSSATYTRGGNMGNNLMTLDGVPIYGSSHLLGFSSAMPLDVIERADYRIGGFGGEDANLTSSHIRLHSADGDFSKFHGKASVSNFLASANLSFPIVKDKLSFIGSFRISPIGLEYRLARNLINRYQQEVDSIKATVYDVYGKFKYRLSQDKSLSLSIFHSYDSYNYGIGMNGLSRDGLKWGNLIGNLQYDSFAESGYTIKASLSFNDNNSGQIQEKKLDGIYNRLEIRNDLKEIKLNVSASRTINRYANIKFGGSTRYNIFNPGTSREYAGDSKVGKDVRPFSSNRTGTFLTSIYGQIELSKEKEYLLQASAAVNAFIFPYMYSARVTVNPDAGILARYHITEAISTEATFDYKTQYFHTLEGLPMGWSLDMIVPSNEILKPEHSLQGYWGWSFRFGPNHIDIGGYYKKMHNLVYYRHASDVFNPAASGWKETTDVGEGTSFGGEFLYDLSLKRLSVQIAYTLSKTDRKFPLVNRGAVFPAKYDRRHILNANLEYAIISRPKASFKFNATFTYQSGHWENVANCYVPERNIIDGTTVPVVVISAVNDIKMPDYIRWDNSLSLEVKRPRCRHNINLGVYNTLNRHNPSFIVYNNEKERWETLSLIPIMPSLYYSIAF